MRTEWGQPISDDDRGTDAINREHEEAMLRDREAGHLDPFDWSVLETIVWIATRDEAAVRGAASYLAGDERQRSSGFLASGLRLQSAGRTRAESLLHFLLPHDVADHHPDCAMFLGDGPCSCAELKRPRYCRCPDPLTSRLSDCNCSAHSARSFIAVFRGTLSASGKRDGESGYEEISARQRVGASFTFDRHRGFRLLPAYAEVKMPVSEIMQRWPADFSDRPLTTSDGDEVPIPTTITKPKSWEVSCLEVFANRVERGVTKSPKMTEARWLKEQLKCNGEVDTISKWLRPYHERLFVDGRFNHDAAAAVLVDLRSDIASKARIK